MTARQEAYDLIRILPDDSVRLLVELLKKMLPGSSTAIAVESSAPTARMYRCTPANVVNSGRPRGCAWCGGSPWG